MKPKYVVIRDNREKDGHGWTFAPSSICEGTEPGTLKTGDYTLRGYEHILCIERKGSLPEFAQNLTQERFKKELDRMREFPIAVVLLEFDMEELMGWPHKSGLPASVRRRIRMTRHLILRRFWELKVEYPTIDFILAGKWGKEVITSLFKRVVEKRQPPHRGLSGRGSQPPPDKLNG